MTNNNLTGALARIEEALDNSLAEHNGSGNRILAGQCQQALSDIQAIRDAVPEGLYQGIKFFGGRQKLAESIKGLDENTDKSLTVCRAANLLHQITQEDNDDE